MLLAPFNHCKRSNKKCYKSIESCESAQSPSLSKHKSNNNGGQMLHACIVVHNGINDSLVVKKLWFKEIWSGEMSKLIPSNRWQVRITRTFYTVGSNIESPEKYPSSSPQLACSLESTCEHLFSYIISAGSFVHNPTGGTAVYKSNWNTGMHTLRARGPRIWGHIFVGSGRRYVCVSLLENVSVIPVPLGSTWIMCVT